MEAEEIDGPEQDEEVTLSLDIKYGKDGRPQGYQNSITNFCRVLEGDPRIAGAICYNELTYMRWVRAKHLPWSSKPVDRAWGNSDEAYLRRWFWEEYGIKSKDVGQMDRIFRRSGLYREGTWDRKTGITTYGSITIQKSSGSGGEYLL